MKRFISIFLVAFFSFIFTPCLLCKAESGNIEIPENSDIKQYDSMFISEEDFKIYSDILKRLNEEYDFHLGFTTKNLLRNYDEFLLNYSPIEFEEKMRSAILLRREQDSDARYLFETTSVSEDECLFTEKDVNNRVAFIENCYLSSGAIEMYQAVLDKLNEEYDTFVCFIPEMFIAGNVKRPLASYTIEEYETEIRKGLEMGILENAKSKNEMQSIFDFDTCTYEFIDINIEDVFNTPYGSNIVNEYKPFQRPSVFSLYEEMESDGVINSFSDSNDSINFTVDNFENSATLNRTGIKTIDGVQVHTDNFVNTLLLLNTTINADSYWQYDSIDGYDYYIMDLSYDRSIPISYTKSLSADKKTASASFSCIQISASGVQYPWTVTFSKSYPVAGDCFTNSPNYSIAHTFSNQNYYHVSSINTTFHCEGYALKYYYLISRNWSSVLPYAHTNDELLDTVKAEFEDFMDDQRIVYFESSTYNSTINPSTYYRVALRVGYMDLNGDGDYDYGTDLFDYHWMIQLGDGSWADKRGDLPSRIVPNSNMILNPQNISWDLSEFGNLVCSQFYNSDVVYYLIAR